MKGIVKSFKLIPVIVITFIFSFAIASCRIVYLKEKEINDTRKMANVIMVDKTLEGEITSVDDIDFFLINSKSTAEKAGKDHKILILNIKLEKNKNSQMELKVYNRERVIKSILSQETTERLVNIGVSPNDIINNNIYISVSISISRTKQASKNTDFPVKYRLSIKTEIPEAGIEIEPDDQQVFANEIQINTPVKGFFNPPVNPESNDRIDYDWYKFRIDEDDTMINVLLSAVPDVDSKIALFDDLGYLIREGDSFGEGEGEKLLNISLSRGLYFVRISPISPDQGNAEIPYILKIEKIDNKNTESEPNDVYPKSSRIEFFRDVGGYFNPVGDVDWFRFNIYDTNTQIVSIKFEPTAYVNPKIELYNSSKEKIISVNDRGTDEGEIIKNIGLDAGVYYIKITDRNQRKGIPQYEYTINIKKKNWEKEDELELNNSFTDANSFEIGELKKGYITPKGDVDFYYFQLSGGEKLRFELSPCILVDLKMDVYDSNGNIIKTFNSDGIEEGESGELILESGLYYVRISSVNNGENSRDNYILRIFPPSG